MLCFFMAKDNGGVVKQTNNMFHPGAVFIRVVDYRRLSPLPRRSCASTFR